jgi:hypothetical protein
MSSINLTSSQPHQVEGNALLAQLLQPVGSPLTYYNKPILPAPAPQQAQVLTPATVLVAPLALSVPSVKTTTDLSRTSQQVKLSNHLCIFRINLYFIFQLANLQPKPQAQQSINQNELKDVGPVASTSFSPGPLSPPKTFRPKNDQERTQYKVKHTHIIIFLPD